MLVSEVSNVAEVGVPDVSEAAPFKAVDVPVDVLNSSVVEKFELFVEPKSEIVDWEVLTSPFATVVSLTGGVLNVPEVLETSELLDAVVEVAIDAGVPNDGVAVTVSITSDDSGETVAFGVVDDGKLEGSDLEVLLSVVIEVRFSSTAMLLVVAGSDDALAELPPEVSGLVDVVGIGDPENMEPEEIDVVDGEGDDPVVDF